MFLFPAHTGFKSHRKITIRDRHPTSPRAELDEAVREDLLRTLRPLDSPPGVRITRDGRELWNFAANDYLGLAGNSRIREAFIEGLRTFGTGSAASRLVTGTQTPHVALEEELATAKHTAAALVFSSGFATAIGLVPAVTGKNDFVIADKLSHASLIDGARLSGATLRVFPHNDTAKLAELLRTIRRKFPRARILIVTESVFSMDGDVCPLTEIVDLAEAHEALLLLDEAHSFGVLGETGMGLAESLGLQARITFQMGTLSKAAGLSGGYLATSREWADLLINRARSFIYSTAPPPALAFAASEALRLIRSETGNFLRALLRKNLAVLSPAAVSPIFPIVLGPSHAALAAAENLADSGFLVPAIRYPTVPRNTARLRVSISAAHPPEIVENLAAEIRRLPDSLPPAG